MTFSLQQIKERIHSSLSVLKAAGIEVDLPEKLRSEWDSYEDALQSVSKNRREVPSKLDFTNAVSILKYHGLRIKFSNHLSKIIEEYELFDGDDSLFKRLIPDVKTYFEYGTGKSTQFVYKHYSADIYCVDTSREWADSVRKIIEDGKEQILNIQWIDVGQVAAWGVPTTDEYEFNFLKYAESLWTLKVEPDLILIDGRFRVLCFLMCLRNARPGTPILFDDYVDRQGYHVVEQFARRIETCGRQVLFEVGKLSKSKVTNELIERYRLVTS